MAKKLKVNAPLTNASKQGRKRLSTEHEDRQPLQISKADRTKSNHQLSSEFTLSSGTQWSARTIRRRLLDAGYRNYIAKRKSIRNASQRKVRFQFANDYITWLSYDWKRIIWSDEAHFELFNWKNRTLIWWTRSKSEKPFSFVSRMQKGGGSINLWSCMTSAKIDNLVLYDGRVNGQTYVHVIGDALIHFIKRTTVSYQCKITHRHILLTIQWNFSRPMANQLCPVLPHRQILTRLEIFGILSMVG